MRFLVISLVSLHPNRSSCFCEGLELGRLVFDLAMDGFECDKFSVSQICRLGDKAMLKTFLVNNPEIDLDRDGATPANMADDKDLKIVLK